MIKKKTIPTGRPTKDTPLGILSSIRNRNIKTLEHVKVELESIFIQLMEQDEVFSIKDLFVNRCYSSETYRDWIEKFKDDKFVAMVHSKIMDTLQSRIKHAVRSKRIPAEFGKFLLKTQFGREYDEKITQETTHIFNDVISEEKKRLLEDLQAVPTNPIRELADGIEKIKQELALNE
jgi:hypothetical protein